MLSSLLLFLTDFLAVFSNADCFSVPKFYLLPFLNHSTMSLRAAWSPPPYPWYYTTPGAHQELNACFLNELALLPLLLVHLPLFFCRLFSFSLTVHILQCSHFTFLLFSLLTQRTNRHSVPTQPLIKYSHMLLLLQLLPPRLCRKHSLDGIPPIQSQELVWTHLLLQTGHLSTFQQFVIVNSHLFFYVVDKADWLFLEMWLPLPHSPHPTAASLIQASPSQTQCPTADFQLAVLSCISCLINILHTAIRLLL